MAKEPTIIIPPELQSREASRLLAQQAYGDTQYERRQHAGEPLKLADTTYSTMASRGTDDGLSAAELAAAYGL